MDDVVTINQSPIKGSRRSNPATYTGLLDHIRKAFAKANKDKGAKTAYFSANHLGQKGRVVILDEPTVGLHPADIEAMLALLDRIVDSGRVVFTGTPAQMVADRRTLTGRYLARYVEKGGS
ncbi:hypothetical protein [Actinomyces naeslundii]|uniref:hypothetical protein n=1 Tax=Actinomyces naeslundii TaxID=1655 RepID=UPI0021166D24|nr:hypothetical protein [Actinomyces naeslundii]